MQRLPLEVALQLYKTDDLNEQKMVEETIQFVMTYPDCFERTLEIGHVTGSAWIVDLEHTHVLLMHHKKLGKWFQPGGHCDGDSDVLAVALKEAKEETGIVAFDTLSSEIFDVDIHTIPASSKAPEHLHYDIRYKFVVDKNVALNPNSESNAVKWVPLHEVINYTDSESILRMKRKTTV